MATGDQPRGREAVRKQPTKADADADSGGDVSLLNMPVGVRRTNDVWMLRVEAELVADGVELENPARPASEATAQAAIEQLQQAELTPAWRVADGVMDE